MTDQAERCEVPGCRAVPRNGARFCDRQWWLLLPETREQVAGTYGDQRLHERAISAAVREIMGVERRERAKA